ncbi:hypothetical protein ABZ464_42275 [Streptomyces sp. NPDC005820]|uniref:hypothetical protein n=1 Tax=Streptomyces sp. NPDC005820 TaxID=3157069 RepID=UPI0033F32647
MTRVTVHRQALDQVGCTGSRTDEAVCHNVLHIYLVVSRPGVAPGVATPLLGRADALCPYAGTAWHGTPTTVTLAP